MTRLLPYGPRAVLGEYDDLPQVMAVAEAVRVARLPGVTDIVPAARTVLVTYQPGTDMALLRTMLEPSTSGSATSAALSTATGSATVVPVRYDGADLAHVAERCGLTMADVVDMHAGVEYVSAFCGFMPGFAYLVGLDQRLQLPRRATPRTAVPPGSVAIASEFTAIYPGASPGGWHLLGTTDIVLWNDAADPPALLAPGTRVRFEPT